MPSIADKFKEMEQQIAAYGELNTALRAALGIDAEADVLEAVSGLVSDNATLRESLEVAEASQAAAVEAARQETSDNLAQVVDDLKVSHATLVGELTARAETAEAEAEKLRMKMAADPAFADASLSGQEAVDTTDAGESADSLWDQYNAISDPAERTRFWDENSAAMNAEIKNK